MAKHKAATEVTIVHEERSAFEETVHRYKFHFLALAAALLVPVATEAQQGNQGYDYFAPQREMIQRGVQAILQCNGLFTSNRSIEQVFDQELGRIHEELRASGLEGEPLDARRRSFDAAREEAEKLFTETDLRPFLESGAPV